MNEPKKKHFVFSARTTEDGLKALNGLKARLGVSWDTLVVDAVCAHYGLDRAVMVDEEAEKAEREKAMKQRKREKERKARAAAKKKEKVAEESPDSTATQAETGEG